MHLPRLRTCLVLLASALAACSASQHPVTPATRGLVVSSTDLAASLAAPGPVRFERIVAADWVVARSGLINLDHPRAREAGLEDGDEAIQIYLYVLEHPGFGTYLVDSGIEAGFREPGGSPRVGMLVEAAMNTAALDVHVTTAEWLADHGRLDGVFLTHIHLDHIMGLPDVPGDVPVFTGPRETQARGPLHLFSRGTTDALIGERGPLVEWPFEPDPSGRFAGVVDVFGDESVFAIHVPGHTPGSTAFLVRSTEGPKLLVGDASHTRWGWENGVEPGTFSLDQEGSARSLAALRAFAAEHPTLEVHLGHQELQRRPSVPAR